MVEVLEINEKIAKLLGWNITIIHDTVFLEHPVILYGFDHHQEFDIFDGSVGSKALCLDLIDKFNVRYNPASGRAQCGCYDLVLAGSREKVICLAILENEGLINTHDPC